MKIICTKFICDENLSKYTDSMLFDSGTSIAHGEVTAEDGTTITFDLCVRGEVCVTYKGDTYYTPSEFPDELTELIKKRPNLWDMDDEDIYVSLNNWFEVIYELPDGYSDGDVFEDDLSKYTPEELKETMVDWTKEFFDFMHTRTIKR